MGIRQFVIQLSFLNGNRSSKKDWQVLCVQVLGVWLFISTVFKNIILFIKNYIIAMEILIYLKLDFYP